uniref:ATP synthase complex subunit 8 n=1 Tax=Glyptotermes sp. 16 AB-2022a TaxID=2942722 RepID=A0A8X8RI43_9NEOP|nr:ATP synthase F0 subunit 8 [Glyptotermes sp. 16 AB-2022a]
MPQMMPLSWLTLFIMFSTTLILFNMMNYYSHIPKTTTTSKNEIKTKMLNWKW